MKRMSHTGRLKGVALVVVLWMVASLALLVTGVLKSVRLQTQTTAGRVHAVAAQARADAAFHLTMQALVASSTSTSEVVASDITFDGVDMSIEVWPLNGLVDINLAPVPLLALSLESLCGFSSETSAELAFSLDDQRRASMASSGGAVRFEALEDLLQVPGFDFEHWSNCSPWLTAESGGDGLVNPLAAPLEILVMLAGGRVDVARVVLDARAAGQVGVDTTSLNAPFISKSLQGTEMLKVIVNVPQPGGSGYRFQYWTEQRADELDGLSWRIFRSERQLVRRLVGEPIP